MHPHNFRCGFCMSEKRYNGSGLVARKRYCKACLGFFFGGEKLPCPSSLLKAEAPPPEGIRTRSTVKWWDPKLGIWRWVAKASKPPIS